jgi:hypothetical protein
MNLVDFQVAVTKSAIEYALSLTGICINKCDVTSAKEDVDVKVTKEWLN